MVMHLNFIMDIESHCVLHKSYILFLYDRSSHHCYLVFTCLGILQEQLCFVVELEWNSGTKRLQTRVTSSPHRSVSARHPNLQSRRQSSTHNFEGRESTFSQSRVQFTHDRNSFNRLHNLYDLLFGVLHKNKLPNVRARSMLTWLGCQLSLQTSL